MNRFVSNSGFVVFEMLDKLFMIMLVLSSDIKLLTYKKCRLFCKTKKSTICSTKNIIVVCVYSNIKKLQF